MFFFWVIYINIWQQKVSSNFGRMKPNPQKIPLKNIIFSCHRIEGWPSGQVITPNGRGKHHFFQILFRLGKNTKDWPNSHRNKNDIESVLSNKKVKNVSRSIGRIYLKIQFQPEGQIEREDWIYKKWNSLISKSRIWLISLEPNKITAPKTCHFLPRKLLSFHEAHF